MAFQLSKAKGKQLPRHATAPRHLLCLFPPVAKLRVAPMALGNAPTA
jgi:hypothetical protein